ncbi:MAG TPA: hypothetical protein VJI75_03310 [Candidatus Nanoarchaeia archaeon]|nr:hypothetical protein [Candidatus Nanoarchaeia archaeon]
MPPFRASMYHRPIPKWVYASMLTAFATAVSLEGYSNIKKEERYGSLVQEAVKYADKNLDGKLGCAEQAEAWSKMGLTGQFFEENAECPFPRIPKPSIDKLEKAVQSYKTP